MRHVTTAHVLLANERYWQTPRAFVQKVVRLFSAPNAPAPLTGADLVHYLEAVPATTFQLPRDVRFVIADFSSLFGATIGAALQRWCTREKLPLVWALGLNLGPMTGPRFWSVGQVEGPLGTEPFPRLLDAVVARQVGINATVSDADVHVFTSAWSAAAAARGPGVDKNLTSAFVNASFDASDWAARWRSLRSQSGSTVHIGPLRAGRCLNIERCIGVDEAADACVCY